MQILFVVLFYYFSTNKCMENLYEGSMVAIYFHLNASFFEYTIYPYALSSSTSSSSLLLLFYMRLSVVIVSLSSLLPNQVGI